MKTRNGFISNSSSSSFVVAFEKIPKSVDELKEMLFGDNTVFEMYGRSYPTKMVAKTVWDDMQKQVPNNKNEIWSALHGYLDGCPDYSNFEKNGSIDWKAYNRATCEHRQKVLKNFKDQNQDADIYCFSYADDDGSYFAVLEHGDLFGKLNHIRISNH